MADVPEMVSHASASGWVLTTFGSGRPWRPALRRLKNQSRGLDRISARVLVSDRSLTSLCPGIATHKKFIDANSRGYGYWIWKPFILLSLMDSHPGAAGYIYIDAGCELNTTPKARERFNEYCNKAKSEGALAFELPFSVADWTHPSLIRRMDLSTHELGSQIAGGIIFLKNCQENRDLLNEWISIMIDFDYLYLTGDLPESPFDVFPASWREHRHDQAILTLLWKKRGLLTIPDESFWHPDWTKSGHDFPIWATRSKLRFSIRTTPLLLLPYRVLRKLLILLSSNRIAI